MRRNPFFTEEVVQDLIETGHLDGTRGAYRLVTPVEKLQVPATVQAVLAARIGAVIGTRVGDLALNRVREVERALGYALGWTELQSL